MPQRQLIYTGRNYALKSINSVNAEARSSEDIGFLYKEAISLGIS